MKNLIVKVCFLTFSLIVTQVAGGENLALKLDGDGDYVTLPEMPQLTSYSISFWFSPSVTWDSAAVDRQVIYEADGLQPDTYIQLNDDGTMRYRTYITPVNNLHTTTDKWMAGAWYQIVVTYDSSSHIKSIYANGIEQSSDTVAIDLALNTQTSHTLGRYTYGESQYFNGRIDEVRIWNYARTQQQIMRDMHKVLTGTEEGLVAYWNFDDATANDMTANGYNGAIMGDAIVAQSDKIDIDYSFLHLDGDGDYMILPQIPKLTSYSVSFWFSPSVTWDSTAVGRQMIYEADGVQPDTYLQLNDDGTVRYRTYITPVNNLHTTTDKWIEQAWYQITITYDSSSHAKSIYANGIEKSANAPSVDLALNTDDFHTLGRYSYGESQYFNGRIDEVRIWNYARTQEEILVDMHKVLTGAEQGLVAYWNFDDATANDATANGYDGTLMGDAKIITEPSVNVDENGSNLPNQLILKQNYPNPFNSETTIKYQLPQSGRVVLKIYNTIGQEIKTLINEEKEAGYHFVAWHAQDIPSGVYFIRFQSGEFVQIKKCLVMK